MSGTNIMTLSDGLELIDQPTDLNTLAVLIRDAVDNTIRAAANATEGALIVGKMLAEAKAQVAHGQWNEWLLQNCNLAPRTARAYMHLANTVPQLEDSKRQRVTDLPLREAIKAIATSPTSPPKPLRTGIREPKRDDRERTVSTLNKAQAALKKSTQLFQTGQTVNGKLVEDLRKKLELVLQELTRMQACSELNLGEVSNG